MSYRESVARHVLRYFWIPLLVGACTTFGTATGPEDAEASVAEGGVDAGTRFCAAHKSAALCADFDDGDPLQIFVGGTAKQATSIKDTGTTLRAEGRELVASSDDNTSGAFVVLGTAGAKSFRFEVRVSQVTVRDEVEVLQIVAASRTVKVRLSAKEIVVRTDTAVLQSSARPLAFSIVVTESFVGIQVGSNLAKVVETPLTGTTTFRLGSGFDVGPAMVHFDDLLLTTQ